MSKRMEDLKKKFDRMPIKAQGAFCDRMAYFLSDEYDNEIYAADQDGWDEKLRKYGHDPSVMTWDERVQAMRDLPLPEDAE